MGDLSGVRVVVTGATSGIGAAMADALLFAGATVAFASRPTARLEASVSQRRSQSLDAVALPMDVRDPASVQAAADRTLKTLGGIDVVVNNAGIGMGTVNPRFLEVSMPFYEVTPDKFHDVVATNLTGYFLVARAFTPLFIEQGKGRFINVTARVSPERESLPESSMTGYWPFDVDQLVPYRDEWWQRRLRRMGSVLNSLTQYQQNRADLTGSVE
jgi:gluconate 5-dehydrogenase